MSNDLIKEEIKDVVYASKVETKKSVSFIWVLPLIITGILGWIAYESYMKKGTKVTIIFKVRRFKRGCYYLGIQRTTTWKSYKNFYA
ncbi:MAG: hypothetical protein R2837_09655 [Aliarcobacter sp.]